MTSIQTDIEARLATVEPDVEVLLAEVAGGQTVRLYVDHPDGVSLELCERITRHLVELRERFALEVSSPGIERPLTKPGHYQRFVGRRARIRTARPVDGARTITGELVGAIAKVAGGGGGGKPDKAQAGGKDPTKLSAALDTAREMLAQALA